MSRAPSSHHSSHRSSVFDGSRGEGSNRHGDEGPGHGRSGCNRPAHDRERSGRLDDMRSGHGRNGGVRPGDGRFGHDIPWSNRFSSNGYGNYYEPSYRTLPPATAIQLQAQASVAEGKFYEDVMYLVSWEAKLGPIDTWPYNELSPRLKDCVDRVKRGKELGREGRAREEQEKMERRRLEWPNGSVRRRTGIVGWRERRGGQLTSVSDRYLDGRVDEPYRMGTEEIGGHPWDFGPERERMLYSWAASRNQATVGEDGREHGQGGRDRVTREEPVRVGAAAGGWPRGWPRGWYERTAAEVDREY